MSLEALAARQPVTVATHPDSLKTILSDLGTDPKNTPYGYFRAMYLGDGCNALSVTTTTVAGSILQTDVLCDTMSDLRAQTLIEQPKFGAVASPWVFATSGLVNRLHMRSPQELFYYEWSEHTLFWHKPGVGKGWIDLGAMGSGPTDGPVVLKTILISNGDHSLEVSLPAKYLAKKPDMLPSQLRITKVSFDASACYGPSFDSCDFEVTVVPSNAQLKTELGEAVLTVSLDNADHQPRALWFSDLGHGGAGGVMGSDHPPTL